MVSQDGGWSAYRNILEGHRVAGRIAFASDPLPGVRLASVLARAADWSIVADLSAALFAVRRLLSTAEAFQAATGSPSLALSGERIVLTPRAAVLLVEPDADTFDAKADGADGARMDIAEIAIAGVSLIAGRPVDAIEASDPHSPVLKEMRDATAIRADMAFADALHEWLDRALAADPRGGFADFRSARAALDALRPPSGCRPSRRILKSYLADLQLPDFANPKLSVLEIERAGELRRAMIARRPAPAAPATAHHDEESWSSIDFSNSAEPALAASTPAAPEPPARFDVLSPDESSLEYEEYKPAEIPASFQLPEPEPEPEPEEEESSIFVKPSAYAREPAPEPEHEQSSAFVAPSPLEPPPQAESEPEESSIFVKPSAYASEPEPAGDMPSAEPADSAEPESVWGKQAYSSEPRVEDQQQPARAEDPNSWIPAEARPADQPGTSDEPMTFSWLPGEARQAIHPDADAASWMSAHAGEAAVPPPVEAAPPPPLPPVEEAAPPPPPPAPVEDDKDWFKTPVQEPPPPAEDLKDWFKSPAQQAPPPPSEDDKDWFKKEQPAPAAEPEEESEEQEVAAAAQDEQWFPERTDQLQEEAPPADLLPPAPVVVPPPDSGSWDKRVAPLREEADLSAPRPDLDAGPATIVHGAGASIAIDRPAAVEEAPKPKRERRPIHIETPSAGRAIGTALVTAAIFGAAIAGAFYYIHSSTPATVTFETKPMGLELLQAGDVKGKTPVTLELRPGTYEFTLRRGKTTKNFHIEVKKGENVTQTVDFTALKPMGTIAITTNPPGAKITLDGKDRGVTPQTLPDIPVGPHTVVLDGEQGTLRRQVNVAEAETTNISEGIFPGFLKVDASFDVKIFEGGRAIGTSDGPITMRAGRHEIELVNESQGYREKRTIEISPGENKRILAK